METGEIVLAPNAARASQIPAVEDFLLRMSDVIGLQIRAKLGVKLQLVAVGRLRLSGLLALHAGAFLGAGARAVLVSLWTIDDHATLEFMKSF